ncbi:MAG: hypothetical protein IJH57_00450 [Mogibacterium sp.]|nr:hypothetical protein [Mogibacterium sp.]
MNSQIGMVKHERAVVMTTSSPASLPFPPMELAMAYDARATGVDTISVRAIS